MKKFTAALLIFLSIISVSYSARIEPQMLSAISKASSTDEITAIVYLKEKADLSGMSRGTVKRVDRLKEFAKIKQKDIASFLETKRVQKKVSAFKSFWIFNGFAVRAVKDVIDELSRRPEVERIETNKTYSLPPEPEVPIRVSAMIPSAGIAEPNIEQIRADLVWSGYNFKGSGVKVGIADTGCLATHVDIKDRIILNATFNDIGVKTLNTAVDTDGHGTHVAGIVAGGNASGKYIGAAPECSLLIAKVFSGSTTTQLATIGGAQWLMENGAQVLNLSLGSDSIGTADEGWYMQINSWSVLFPEVVIIAAIGNHGPSANTTTSPGNVPDVLGVGAVDDTDTIASYSSRGPIIWDTTTYTKPDVCAPGTAIKSAAIDGGYAGMTGSSMATPHLAGIIALMLQANPTIEAIRVKDLLKVTAIRKSGISYPNSDYGWGRADALLAVTAGMSPDALAPTIESVSAGTAVYGGDVNFTVQATDNVTSSPAVNLYYLNDTGIWNYIAMSQDAFTSTFRAVIPGSAVKSNMRYYIEASDYSGNISRAPSGAPSDSYVLTVAPKDKVTVSDHQTVPNPFSPSAGPMTLLYNLSKAGDVTMKIYSITGSAVRAMNMAGSMGTNSFLWDGKLENGEDAANGVYVYQIVARDASGNINTATGKIIVLK